MCVYVSDTYLLPRRSEKSVEDPGADISGDYEPPVRNIS